MTFTLQELATLSGAELIGDPKLQITGAASLGEATPGEISFFANRKYIGLLRKTRASAIFVPPDFAEPINAAQVRVSNPTKAFEQVLLKFAPSAVTFAPGIHSTAIVDPSVQLGERVSIQPLAVIEAGTRIGDDTIVGAGSYIGHETVIGFACHIYPQVTIRERSKIGSRVIVHSGAVIGADGFGFEMVDGRQEKIQQLGIVQIDDDVEIGANTTIDRARFGRTWIQQGVKIDNLVQIAHNVGIGKDSALGGDNGIFPDYYVVRDLHEIVDLYALLNPGPAKTSAVDGRVRADFDIVIDLDNPELRNFLVLVIHHLKSKTVRADHHAAVNNHTRPNARSLPDCYPRINQARRPNHGVVANI